MSRYSHRNQQQEIPSGYWRASQSYVLATITLVVGVVVGYLIHGSAVPTNTALAGSSSGGFSSSLETGQQQSDPVRIANGVEPLLAQLKARPNDVELLVQIGNQYYDGHLYGKAIEFYKQALSRRPDDVDVRTDMGTAIWYSGDAEGAIREYEASLKYQPTHAQTLFNMGIVKWQGKHDPKAALESWQKLLATNPGYPDRQKVEQMMQQAQAEIK
jgi:cytochrome c-type biogenesis protein CcmH/NrfG